MRGMVLGMMSLAVIRRRGSSIPKYYQGGLDRIAARRGTFTAKGHSLQ